MSTGAVVTLRPVARIAGFDWGDSEGESIARWFLTKYRGASLSGGPWYPFTSGWARAFRGGRKCAHFWRRVSDDPVTYLVHGKVVRQFSVESYCGVGPHLQRSDAGMFHAGNFPRCKHCERLVGQR